MMNIHHKKPAVRNLETATILVVEDESIIAMDLSNTLTILGYSVPAIASSGEEAVSLALSLKPSLILMDIQLKGNMDGIAAVRAIKKQTDIPAVYLTAHANETTFLRAIETGPYGYLLKPIGKNDLYTTIETALHRRSLELSLQASETRYRDLVDTLPQAVVEHDPSGIITFCNTSFCRLTGYQVSDLLGISINALIPSTAARGENVQLSLFPDETPLCYQTTARIAHRDGTMRQVHINGNRKILKNGDAEGYLTVLTDFSDINFREKPKKQAGKDKKIRPGDSWIGVM